MVCGTCAETADMPTARSAPATRCADGERLCGGAPAENRQCRVRRSIPPTHPERALLIARGSGGTPGERNGQYRHGERTKAAIAQQRKFSALLKMLRAGLTNLALDPIVMCYPA